MAVRLEGISPPQSGQLAIDIKLSATINISAFAARQKVNGFVVDEISTNMHGVEPALIVGQRLTWRVPLVLSIPPRGDLGAVGEIDVDVATGEILYTRALISEIQQRARELAARPASQAN